jgi:hypothetical protein
MFPSNHRRNHLDETATFLDLCIVSLLMVPAISIVHLMVGPSRRAETIATETFPEAFRLAVPHQQGSLRRSTISGDGSDFDCRAWIK